VHFRTGGKQNYEIIDLKKTCLQVNGFVRL
jgi:hypothetical protein